jgi:hypothetical protein
MSGKVEEVGLFLLLVYLTLGTMEKTIAAVEGG